MFVLSKKASFVWPVKVKIPTDGGKHQEMTFSAVFKYLSRSEIKKLVESSDSDESFCKAVVVNWKDVQDDAGNTIEFNAENFEALLDVPNVSKALVETYIASYAQAAAKN